MNPPGKIFFAFSLVAVVLVVVTVMPFMTEFTGSSSIDIQEDTALPEPDFVRITAEKVRSAGWSRTAFCPEGYTLIDYGVANYYVNNCEGMCWAHCECEQIGNGIRAYYNGYYTDQEDYGCECHGLCAKD